VGNSERWTALAALEHEMHVLHYQCVMWDRPGIPAHFREQVGEKRGRLAEVYVLIGELRAEDWAEQVAGLGGE
jgi:hypothetical protein